MLIRVDQTVPAYESYAAERTRGLYNVAPSDGQRFRLNVNVPLERSDWAIGMIVGPSGSGKSSIVRCLREHGFEEPNFAWPTDEPIIEVLTKLSKFEKASGSLASVGLGSVPSWLRPHQVLSTGEKFRADMAQLLLGGSTQAVLDEFTSVLDRQVAQVGAGAFAKAWRRVKERRIILVGCHYDILEWVQPDWWIDTAEGLDEFAEDRATVQARKGTEEAVSERRKYPGQTIGSVTV